MLTFKFFKRLLALIVVLLVAVSADAQMQTFTVTNTKTSGTGSFQDAINTVNAEGGSWTIQFKEGLDTIVVAKEQTISVDTLRFLGNEKTVLKWDDEFSLIKVKKFDIDKMHFFSKKGGTLIIDGGDIYINHIAKSVFDGITINIGNDAFNKLNEHIGSIHDCIFKNNANRTVLNVAYYTEESRVDVIKNCSFDVTGSTYGNSVLKLPYVMNMSNCDFHQSYGYTISRTFGTIDNCSFLSDNISFPEHNSTIAFGNVTCEKLKNCTFKGYGCNFFRGKFNVIDQCDFEGGQLLECVFGDILNSEFLDKAYIAWGSADLIKDCRFVENGPINAAIFRTDVKEIDGCTFTMRAYPSIQIDAEGTYIHNNIFTFTGDGEAIFNINKNDVSGRYSQNLIYSYYKGAVDYIKNSSEQVPEFKSVSFQNGIFNISGSCGANADVEIFQNNGDGVSAIKYLKTVKADANGDFQASIAASALDVTGNSCFIATATYDESRTSALSKSICYELPLNVYVKKTGNGSGKNWKDAMSEDDFYGVLPNAKNGTTFHIAAGDYERDGYYSLPLQINTSVSIIGGYPDTNDDVDKVKSDPVNNHTRFKEKGGKGYNPFYKLVGSDLNVEFHNAEFFDTWLESYGIMKKITVDSCRFYNCVAIYQFDVEELVVRNSYMKGILYAKHLMKNPQIGCSGTKATIEHCTFECEQSNDNANIHLSLKGYGSITNCTFYNVCQTSATAILFNAETVTGKFENNTIIAKNLNKDISEILSLYNVEFDGNIYAGKDVNPTIEKLSANNNNLLSFKSISSTNKVVSDFSTILEGKTIDDVFVPTLAYNGGFTPTVKLISDKLADGSSFRFPLEETSVTVDQRGETRLTSTCPGAYEIPFIVPDLKEIYVKQSGKGSGASWTDAMSPKDFVNVLPFANEGTTFYVAAGTYDFNKLSDGKYVYENKNYSYTYENYPVKNGVIIRGGYPENPTSEVPSDPATNKTIFTSLYKASSRDASVLQFLSSSELHNLYFDDLLLEVNKADGEMTPTLLIDSCVISATEANFTYDYKNINHINVQKGGLDVRNTTFNGYCGYLINASECSAVYIQNSTFAPTKVSGSTSIMLGTTKTSVVWIVNNTFYKAESASLIQCGSSCPLQFYNNTVVSKYGYRLIGSLDAVGNLFYSISDAKGSYMYAQKPQSNMYNVVVGTDGYDGDMMVAAADLATILSGSVVGGSFEPELANNGGYTQTVKLVGTKLPDGTSIKFPRSASGIYVDQRDVSRMESTCAGAYELSVAGLNEVYVKKDGQGNGTSWDDAMGEADFFAALPLAKEGTTFYVAAGEYVKTESSPVWLRNGIKVIGGYPAKAKKGAVSDPVNNHTVLKASSDKASMTISYMYNFDCGSGKQTAEFHNLDFFGTRLDLNVDNIVIDSCNFYECYNPVNVNCAQNLRISNSYFALNKVKSDKFDYSININCDPVAVIENCTFDEKPYTTAIKVNSELDEASVRIVNNTFLLRDRANTEWADEEGEHYYFYLGSKKLSLFQNNTVIIVDALGQMNVSKSINKIGTKNGDFYYNLYNVYDDKLFSSFGEGGSLSCYSDFGGTINVLNNGIKYNVSTEVKNIIETQKKDDAYIPVLAYNGGYTPTIKLINDKLSDGTFIRTSQISTHKLATDQRGVTRLNETCVGAVELERENLSLKSVFVDVYGSKCIGKEGYIEVSWTDKSYNTSSYQFKMVLTDENGKKIEGALQDQSAGSGTFQITGLKNGTYSFELYVKKADNFVAATCDAVNIRYSNFSPSIDETPTGKNKFIMVEPKDAFHVTYITAGAGRKNDNDPNEPACKLDDHKIRMTVKGGTAPYTFSIYNSNNKLIIRETPTVNLDADGYFSYTSRLLAPDSYVVYVSDASGCEYGDDVHANFTAKHQISLSSYERSCDSKNSSHIKIKTQGEPLDNLSLFVDKLSEVPDTFVNISPVGKRYVDLLGIYKSGMSTFEDGCVAFSPIVVEPLSQSFIDELYKIRIDKPYEKKDQTCYGVDNGSFTIYPKAEFENDIYGNFTYFCVLVDAETKEKVQKKEGIILLDQPVTFEGVAPGKYSAYFSYQMGLCDVGQRTDFLKFAEIAAVKEPVITNMNDIPVIRCKDKTATQKFNVVNYDKNIYTWELTKDDVDFTSKVDATVPTTEEGEFVFKGLTAGDYVFSLVDQCGNPFSKSFTVLESIKKTMKVVDNSGGVSCEGKSDAYFDINVTNWNTGDKCSITNAETGKELEVSKTTKGTYISLFSYHLPGGKYNVDVTDLCGTTYPTVVVDLDELGKESKFGVMLEAASDEPCNDDYHKILATVSGITSEPYTFTLYKEGEEEELDSKQNVDESSYNSGKLDNGNYKLVVENGLDCKAEATFTVKPVSMQSLANISIDNVDYEDQTCFGVDNGEITVRYSGNSTLTPLKLVATSANGTQSVVTGSAEKAKLTITDLAPGTYDLVLDHNLEGCETSATSAAMQLGKVTITGLSGQLSIDAASLVKTQPTCAYPFNGTVEVDIHNWVDGSSNVTVYRNGSPQWGTYYANFGEYTSNAPGLLYYVDEEHRAANIVHLKFPKASGTIMVQVEDECDYIATLDDIQLEKFEKPSISLVEEDSHLDLDCNSSADGRLVFAVAGESASLFSATYKAENGDLITAKPDETGKYIITDLSAGQYTFGINSTVDGCKDAATETVEITAPRPIEIHKLSPAPVVCVAEGTTAYASVGGGTPDYTYRWTDAKGNLLGTGDKVEHLSVGNDYKLVVTDSKLCKDSATFNVGAYQMDPLTDISVTKFGSKDQTCFGVDNGEIRVYYSGNTSETPLKLLVIGADGVAHKAVSASEKGNIVVTDLAPGVYSVFLDHDNEWCEQETPAAIALGEKTISPVGELAIDKKSLVINVATCSKPMNGSAEIDVLNWVDGGHITVYRNGSPQWGTVQCEKKPYTSPAPGWFYYENAEKMAEHTAHLVIPRIDGGDFKVEVVDDCEDTVTYEFVHEKMLGPAFAYADDQVLDLKCSTDSYGKIAFHTTGGSIFSYYVNDEEMTTDGADKYVKENLPAGTYTVSSKSKLEGCKDGFKEEVVITAPPALVASPKAEPVYCDEVGATAKANVVGGTPEFTYSWTDAEGKEVGKKDEVSHLKADETYTLVVTDANMCQTSSTVSPKYAAPLTSISVNKVEEKHQKCYGVDNGEITVSFSGNTSNASLKLVAVGVDGKPKKDVTTDLEEGSVVISDLAPGTYDVRLGYNVSGCEVSDQSLSVAKDLVILALDKPVFLKDKKKVEDNPCENIGKGRMHLEMVGWTPDVYKWTLKRAGQTDAELKPQSHCGDKLPNGATAFDLMTLPEGENVFTMWDACGIIHMDTAIIGHRDLAPITIDTVNSKAISCEGRTDGGLTFVAWPWDVEDKALITLEDDTINVTPVITDGKAYFELNGHGAGTYTLTTTDLCGDKKPKDIDFTAFSAQNGMLTVDVDFDAEAAKCDVEKRVFKVTANGGTAPYVYSITKGNATVQTTEATEKKSFNSQLLTDGTYVVTVTDKTDCKAVYDNGLTIKPSHTLKADMHEVACGEGKSVTISTLVDGGKTSATHYVAVDETGKKFQPSSFEDGIVLFENVPVNVTLKGLVAEVDGCNVYAELGKLPLDATALAEAKVTVDKVINERCYGAKDGGLKLSYNGPKSSYDVAMRLVGVNGTTATINTPNKRGTNLSFEFEKLAPGEYELYLVQKVGQCDAGTEPKKIQKVKIEEMPHKFELLWDTVIQSTCYSEMNGHPKVKVRGWSEDNCTWVLLRHNGKEYTLDATNIDAFPISGDTATWQSDHLKAGLYKFTWTACNTTVSKEFEIEPLKKPSLKVLASSNTDLKCNYDKAYVDFHYEGGTPLNKRILIKYLPVGNSNDDWDFTNEELKAENTYRLYGFTPGSGNMGHKKAVGITYKLTDEDKGLPDGKYTIVYEDTTGACEKDNRSAVVTVRRNNPINIQAYKRDVVCNEKAQGTLAFTFGRPGYTWPSYTDDSYYDKYTGINWASLIFMSDKNQEKMYRREVNQSFTVYTNEQLELIKKTYEKYGFPKQIVKYIIEQYKKSIPFRSNMFSDVKKVELIARGVSQEKLYSRLAQTLDTLMKYPLDEMYKDGLNYKVPTDWMGFNTLYADYYNVVVTDTFGCRYVSDTIHISMPNYQKPLTIDNMVYDDKEGFCDADKRRITFRVSGGWGDYHYSAVNLDSADVEKSLADLPDNPDDGVSYGKLLDKNYVADARIETHGKKGTPDYYEIYTTPIQKPGRIRVSVVDSLGCKTNGQDITLTAKYLMSGLTQNDWCSPDEKNNFYPVLLNGDKSTTAAQVDSFKVRIGHRTVRDDSVEYRKVLPSELVLNTRVTDGAPFYGKKYIEKVPGGQVGFFAYMEDGCSAFGEYDFGMRDDFRELKLTAEGTIPSYCYNDSTGALLFSIYGGNEYYKKLYLDDVDLMSNSGKELITKHLVTTEHVEENNVDKVKVDTTDYDLTFNDFTSKELYADLNRVYGNQFKKDPDPVQYSYYFTLQNLGGNTHLVNPLREDTYHRLVVEDTKGCRDTLAFKVDQPEMLYIRAAGSVMCADGSGRIYVDSVAGGVGGYLYSLDKTYNFDENTHKKVMFDGITKHTLSVTDAHGCVSLPSAPISTGETISWDDVEQDVMISTWHDYGDVLVVIDKTNYHRLKYNSKSSPYYGKPYDYNYDSIKVEIIRGDGFPEQVVGRIQPKEFYTYGIPSQSFADGENGDADVDTTGMHIDGSVSVYIPWLGKDVQGPSWGVPAEVVATVKTDEQLKFMDVQYGLEVAALNDTVNMKIDKICGCGYLNNLSKLSVLLQKEYPTQSDKNNIQYLENVINSIKTTYVNNTGKTIEETAKKQVGYSDKVDALKKKYGFGYGTLSQIREVFTKLVPDSAAERMTFIKFEEIRGTNSDGTPAPSVLDKYFNTETESEVLPFAIRTTTYISGCDITEEYNPLILNLKGDNPYPDPDFRNSIKLECVPSILSNNQSQTELIVRLSRPENFSYQVFGLDGRLIKAKTANTVVPVTQTSADGKEESVYTITLTGITQSSVVKVCTDSDCAATKVLVR